MDNGQSMRVLTLNELRMFKEQTSPRQKRKHKWKGGIDVFFKEEFALSLVQLEVLSLSHPAIVDIQETSKARKKEQKLKKIKK